MNPVPDSRVWRQAIPTLVYKKEAQVLVHAGSTEQRLKGGNSNSSRGINATDIH